MYEKRITIGHNNEAHGEDATRREEVALHLSQEAMRNAQRAIVGLFAIPASVGLGLAATVTYAAAFLERGFEIFERSLEGFARDGERTLIRTDREPERAAARAEEPGEKPKQARS